MGIAYRRGVEMLKLSPRGGTPDRIQAAGWGEVHVYAHRAEAPDGRVMLAALRKQAELDVDIACFGHGEPLTENTSAILRSVARRV